MEIIKNNTKQLNWEKIPSVKVSQRELKMIKEADNSGLCNSQEKKEIEKILNKY